MEKRPETLMPLEVFTKILSDLEAVDYRGAFHLYLMAEPLCDPRLLDLIRLTRERFEENTIFISTNGDRLATFDDVERLFNAGLSYLGISHYDTQNEHLKQYEHPRIVHTNLNDLRLSFYNRAGLVGVAALESVPSCEWLWQKAYINYRGDVVLCCSDYYYTVVMGNVIEESFPAIFNNDKYSEYRNAHNNGQAKRMALCQTCNRVK
jgi:radical SAM protein with 4Fe4S-binding SPASM domain